jgi:hypothetical protein
VAKKPGEKCTKSKLKEEKKTKKRKKKRTQLRYYD